MEAQYKILAQKAMEDKKLENLHIDLVKDCLKMQLEEFDLLKSIYQRPGECTIDNPLLESDINDFIIGVRSSIHENLDYRIKFNLSERIKCELSIFLPQLYPLYEIPMLTIRTDNLHKKQEDILKKAIEEHIHNNIDKTCPYIYQIIDWMQDNSEKLVKEEEVPESKLKSKVLKEERFERLWVYSHHIYSKNKRHDIIKLSKDYNLRGFMLSGKPGIMCFEGTQTNTQKCWREIKSWLWQKIKVVKIETLTISKNAEDFYRFPLFHELLFVENENEESSDDVKMNMSEFFKYLDAHQSTYMRKLLFGFD